MEIFKIVGVGFITAISAILLKQTKPELAFAVTIAGVIIVLMLSATLLEQTDRRARFRVEADGRGKRSGENTS